MNENLNKFFAVKSAVEKHKEAKFWAYHPYAKRITLFIAMACACIGLIAIIVGIGKASFELFSWGVGLGGFLLLFTFMSNTKIGIFLTKELSFLLFGGKIEDKTNQSKRAARAELYELGEVISLMDQPGSEWKTVAQDAYKILNIVPIRSY